MPTKSPKIKTSDLGRGRGGRPCAGQQAPGPTRLINAAVPEHCLLYTSPSPRD